MPGKEKEGREVSVSGISVCDLWPSERAMTSAPMRRVQTMIAHTMSENSTCPEFIPINVGIETLMADPIVENHIHWIRKKIALKQASRVAAGPLVSHLLTGYVLVGWLWATAALGGAKVLSTRQT